MPQEELLPVVVVVVDDPDRRRVVDHVGVGVKEVRADVLGGGVAVDVLELQVGLRLQVLQADAEVAQRSGVSGGERMLICGRFGGEGNMGITCRPMQADRLQSLSA